METSSSAASGRPKRAAAPVSFAGPSPLRQKSGGTTNPAGKNQHGSSTASESAATTDGSETAASSAASSNIRLPKRRRSFGVHEKGASRPGRHKDRKLKQFARQQQLKCERIADYEDQRNELERRYKRGSWQAGIAFAVLAHLITALYADESVQLLAVCSSVGAATIMRPCARVVLNIYNSWRLNRDFVPSHRGKTRWSLFDDHPMLKRKAVKWTRRRLYKRKKDEAELTASIFMQKMNEWFVHYKVYEDPGAAEPKPLKWSESTALRHMHAIKLEYGCYARGYCDGHERADRAWSPVPFPAQVSLRAQLDRALLVPGKVAHARASGQELGRTQARHGRGVRNC